MTEQRERNSNYFQKIGIKCRVKMLINFNFFQYFIKKYFFFMWNVKLRCLKTTKRIIIIVIQNANLEWEFY
jgi:hypothetical protein